MVWEKWKIISCVSLYHKIYHFLSGFLEESQIINYQFQNHFYNNLFGKAVRKYGPKVILNLISTTLVSAVDDDDDAVDMMPKGSTRAHEIMWISQS